MLISSYSHITCPIDVLDIFVHMQFFSDAFQLSSSDKRTGCEALLVSLAEVGHVDGWGHIFPSILPLSIFSKSAKQQYTSNYFLKLLTPSVHRLANGIDVYCKADGKTYRIFGGMHSLLGDSIGRADIGERFTF